MPVFLPILVLYECHFKADIYRTDSRQTSPSAQAEPEVRPVRSERLLRVELSPQNSRQPDALVAEVMAADVWVISVPI